MGRGQVPGARQMDLGALISSFFDWLSNLLTGASPAAGGAPVQLSAENAVSTVLVKDAIQREIVDALGLPQQCLDFLYDQFKAETANGTAWYFQGPQPDGKPPTFNLFNRHAGSGRGDWTHESKYVGPGDEDIRIFTDVYQSARDYVQLLNDPLYREALMALQRGDGGGYFHALDVAGFDSHSGNYAAIASRWGYVESRGIFG